jgi:uncharacterized protein YciI
VSLFVVTYTYVDDPQAMAEVRPAHRAFIASLTDLVLSGPTDDNGAVLILDTLSADEALALLDDDPFRAAGFVAERSARGWTVVSGRAAAAVVG